MKNQNETMENSVAEVTRTFKPESSVDCLVYDSLAGGTECERVFLCVDWRDGDVDVVTRGNHEMNSCSGDVWHHLVGEYRVYNTPNAYRLADWIDENLEMLGRVRACFEETWDGSNWVGQFDFDDDAEASDFYDRLTDGIVDVEAVEADITTAAEYFSGSFEIRDGVLHASIGDTPTYTLEYLGSDPESVLERLMDDSLDGGYDGDYWIVVGTGDYAMELVEELRDANDD